MPPQLLFAYSIVQVCTDVNTCSPLFATCTRIRKSCPSVSSPPATSPQPPRTQTRTCAYPTTNPFKTGSHRHRTRFSCFSRAFVSFVIPIPLSLTQSNLCAKIPMTLHKRQNQQISIHHSAFRIPPVRSYYEHTTRPPPRHHRRTPRRPSPRHAPPPRPH